MIWRLICCVLLIPLRNCIECLGFNIGPFKANCSEACSTVVPYMQSELRPKAKQCELKDSEGCWIKFSLDQLVGVDTYSAVIQSERGNTEQLVTFHMVVRLAPNTKRTSLKQAYPAAQFYTILQRLRVKGTSRGYWIEHGGHTRSLTGPGSLTRDYENNKWESV